MSVSEIKAIQSSLSMTQEWLKDVMETYEYENEEEAFALLRASLKSLRDRISSGEAHHLGSQLPAVLRGFFFEGWDPAKGPLEYKSTEGMLATVKNHLGGREDIDLELAVPGALKVIFLRLGGEKEHVLSNLPGEIQEFLS